jgi:predicted cupin superfamily sugar epimerase
MERSVNPEVARWIEALSLQAHPEGGWYAESFRASRRVVDPETGREYSAGTSIYYLLDDASFSAFHRVGADETWHFYAGTGLSIFHIDKSGHLHKHRLGRDVITGEKLQLTIPAHEWFACQVEIPGGFALCGCTVSPGFEFHEFALASREELISAYPIHKNLIVRLTL